MLQQFIKRVPKHLDSRCVREQYSSVAADFHHRITRPFQQVMKAVFALSQFVFQD